ncbi:MAG: cell division protein FtsQ/DivIB [Gammaproteobacteria bacterium]
MRYFLILCITLSVSCTNQNKVELNSIHIKSSKEFISSLDQTKSEIINHLLDVNQSSDSDIFSKSWVSMIKTTHLFNKELNVEITEHQPMAILGQGKFMTQEGKVIFPGERTKELKLISIIGPDLESSLLLEHALFLQNILNIKGHSVISIEDKGSDFLQALDDHGTKYNFSKGDFRVQLERLEQFTLFELNSGKIDHIRYIDLRYKNAIAVNQDNREKTI